MSAARRHQDDGTRALDECSTVDARSDIADEAARSSPIPQQPELLDRRTWYAIAAIGAIQLVELAMLAGGYIWRPKGSVFTGNVWYAEDGAQHEMWAREMWVHVFARNLLTPQPTSRSWFFSPLEWFYGGLRAITNVPYPVVTAVLGTLCVIPFVLGLIHLAWQTGVKRARICAVVAVFAGGFAPLVAGLRNLGLLHVNGDVLHQALSVSSDATPGAVGLGVNQLLIVAVLVGLAWGAAGRMKGFALAGIALAATAAVYPFYAPTLGVVTVVCLVLWRGSLGRERTTRAALWALVPAIPPFAYYALLPKIDSEFAHFQALNHQPIFSLKVLLLSFGVGLIALAGVPRLFRGGHIQQMFGVLAVTVLFFLFIPQTPWRSHLLHFSPFLVIGAFAAWEPVFERLGERRRRIGVLVVIGCMIAGAAATPYYLWKMAHTEAQAEAPQFITSGEHDAITWLAERSGNDTVLAPSNVSPWVAAWASKRVVVGHFLWTHNYDANRRNVDAIYAGVDPSRLIRQFGVKWILVDTTSLPTWAHGLQPAAHFSGAEILDSAAVLATHERRS
jgi:hypothetical protein